MDTVPESAVAPIDWLLRTGRLAPASDDLLGGLCELLVAQGLPLERVGIHGRVIHPQVVGIRILWRRGIGSEETRYGYDTVEAGYDTSPLKVVYESGQPLRRRLKGPPADDDFPILPDLRAEGMTDYLVTPLEQPGGQRQAATWATRHPNGFSDAQIAAIMELLPALAAVTDARTQRRVLKGLLSVYLGASAGAKVLAGTIRRGDGETIAAAIWLVDLRDFTATSEVLPGPDLIELLNEYFELMAGPVEDHGGEILKFIGDAMLAIFPIADDLDRDRACRTALASAKQALARLDETNAARIARGDKPMELGLALHTGPVMYGNIGAPERLDFTVIGPAVNLTARIAGLCRPLGRRLLTSARFASPCGSELVSLGFHPLRGLSQPQEVFALPGDEGRQIEP
ncbi:MAG TPA: adenylate/guanylate cyclase domain-containing protein [Dongiaceae bacterium]|nr:adenylate/guanylate cyclase domain-containing protein [Dongiaceae bacterium]